MIPRRAISVNGVERLEIKFGGKKYATQFTGTGTIKDQEFTYKINQISVDVTLAQITAKRGIKTHSE